VMHFLLSFSLPIATPVQKTVGIQNQDWYLCVCVCGCGCFFLVFVFIRWGVLLVEIFSRFLVFVLQWLALWALLLINVLETVGICSYSAPICCSRKSVWLHLVKPFLRQKSERRSQEGRGDRRGSGGKVWRLLTRSTMAWLTTTVWFSLSNSSLPGPRKHRESVL
jgi:hypothetical protein